LRIEAETERDAKRQEFSDKLAEMKENGENTEEFE
jgi:hypothetical protein